MATRDESYRAKGHPLWLLAVAQAMGATTVTIEMKKTESTAVMKIPALSAMAGVDTIRVTTAWRHLLNTPQLGPALLAGQNCAEAIAQYVATQDAKLAVAAPCAYACRACGSLGTHTGVYAPGPLGEPGDIVCRHCLHPAEEMYVAELVAEIHALRATVVPHIPAPPTAGGQVAAADPAVYLGPAGVVWCPGSPDGRPPVTANGDETWLPQGRGKKAAGAVVLLALLLALGPLIAAGVLVASLR